MSKMCDSDRQHKKPCGTCPFSRKVEAGKLGGSGPAAYIGQIHAGMWLPCHTGVNFDDPQWRVDFTAPQCAGAAMFRTAVAATVTPHILRLPVTEAVFNSEAEFLAHHCQVTEDEAAVALTMLTPAMMAKHELSKASVQRVEVTKDST